MKYLKLTKKGVVFIPMYVFKKAIIVLFQQECMHLKNKTLNDGA